MKTFKKRQPYKVFVFSGTNTIFRDETSIIEFSDRHLGFADIALTMDQRFTVMLSVRACPGLDPGVVASLPPLTSGFRQSKPE